MIADHGTAPDELPDEIGPNYTEYSHGRRVIASLYETRKNRSRRLLELEEGRWLAEMHWYTRTCRYRETYEVRPGDVREILRAMDVRARRKVREYRQQQRELLA